MATGEFGSLMVVWWLSHLWLFCKPTDCSLPGSSVHGIFQDISSSMGSSWPSDRTQVFCVSCIVGSFYHWAAWEARSTRSVRLTEAVESSLVVPGQFSLCLLCNVFTPQGFSLASDGLRSLLRTRRARQLLSFPDHSRWGSGKQQLNSFKTCLAKRKVGLFQFVLSWHKRNCMNWSNDILLCFVQSNLRK